MTATLTSPAALRLSRFRGFSLARTSKFLSRALISIFIGAVISILIAWMLGLWAQPESANVISANLPQRGRMWEISIWDSSGAMRIHSLRQAHSWGGWQVTGPPDSTMNGDSGSAWCPATENSQAEWLVLDYPQPIQPTTVQVYENYCPGAVNRITAFKENGEEVEAWRGQDPTPPSSAFGISNIPVNVPFKTQRIKVYLDSAHVVGWNEIDAVGLIDREGTKLWACDVQESSSYANLNAVPSPLSITDLVPAWCPLISPDSKPAVRSPNSPSDERLFEARGWPMLAMWSERPGNWITPPATLIAGRSISPRILSRTPPGVLPPILPLGPIWSGLLFDSIFYAMLLGISYWILIKPRRLVLELLRLRRGCCIACGYELDFDFRAGCPECGWRRSHR